MIESTVSPRLTQGHDAAPFRGTPASKLDRAVLGGGDLGVELARTHRGALRGRPIGRAV